MNKKWNVIFQATMIALQIGNAVVPALPEDQKPVATGVMTIIQGIAGILAHNYNADGTPSTVAYVPKAKNAKNILK